MRAPWRLVVLAAVSAAVLPVPAQQTPTFRAGVDLTPVDVSVLNKKDRSPVRGLKAEDFTVLEDGKAQPIVVFTPVDVAPPAPPPSPDDPGAWTRTVAKDVTSNDYEEAPENRLFVLYVDDAMLPADPAVLRSVKDIGRKMVDRLGPNDRMAVVFAVGSGRAEDFTSDRGRLLTAVDLIPPGLSSYTFGWESVPPRSIWGMMHPTTNPVPGANPDLSLMSASLKTLQGIADAMIATPSRRKILVYVGAGIPINTGLAGSPMHANQSVVNREVNAQLGEDLRDLFREMQRANIVVYPVSPLGVEGIDTYIARQIRALATTLSEYRQDSYLDPSTGLPPVVACNNLSSSYLAWCLAPLPEQLGHLMAGLSTDFVLESASNTGGVAVINTNDFSPGVDRIFDENSSYYLLGYRPPDPRPNGKLHRLEVKVDRKDVIVRTRNLYAAESPTKTDRDGVPIPPPPPLATATAGMLPTHELPMDVTAIPVAVAGKPEAAVAIAIGLHHLAVPSRVKEAIDVQVSAFTPDGQARGVERQTATVILVPNRAEDTTRYEMLSRIDLKPGRYQLRVAAHRNVAGTTGSVYVDVDVPDFAHDRLSASGVAMAMLPAVEVSPRDLLTPLLPIVPTAARVFERRGRATAFFRLYQGGSDAVVPVALTTRLLDTRGRGLVNETRTIGVDQFVAGRAADVRFDVPLLSLPPGEYLMTFEASLDKHVMRRDVRFSVR
jgi:VWFA-related protein